MFNRKKIMVAIVCSGLTIACSHPAAEQQEKRFVQGREGVSRVGFSVPENDISVFIFQSSNGGYFYADEIHGGWTPSGTSFIQDASLDPGDYKFLFTRGYGNNLLLNPENFTVNTGYDAVSFVQQEAPAGVYASCDELFLAEKQYTVSGSDEIEATLARQVSRLDLNLKRGIYKKDYSETSDYEPVPYEGGETVLDYIESIELTITGAGNEIVPGGVNKGSVKLIHTMEADGYKTLSADGFAQYEGPYFIPTGNAFTVDIKITPVDGKGLPSFSKQFEGLNISKNKKLTVTLWITELYLTINVSAETSPIEDIVEGDSGLWD